MPFLRHLALVGAVALAAHVQGCAKEKEEATLLQADDLAAPEGFTFDPATVLEDATFTDFQALDSAQIQQFFRAGPYKRSSFLETYQSNGVRAVDAILRAASTYRINPIVFIARAQADQGLVGEQYYPSPPTRVEYAFGCGCPGRGACDPRLAGFDRQIDCLGRALRKGLDEIAKVGTTAGGWGPNAGGRTLDGRDVVPTNAATAVLYQYLPVVAEKQKGGSWVFWSLFNRYAERLDYVGPIGGGVTSAWIGDRCTDDLACTYESGTCEVSAPGGMCTASCSPDLACPSQPGRVPAFCANLGGAGFCLPICDPNVPASCRPGFLCGNGSSFATPGEMTYVCVPP